MKFLCYSEDGARCVACGGDGLWLDCDIHAGVQCYAIRCEACGVVDRDCEDPR